MQIHVYCHRFAPDIGGMERLLQTLCSEFVRLGHAVEVVTESLGESESEYLIHRAPTAREYLRIAQRADVILSAPLSLRRLGSQLASGRPVCVAHPLVPLLTYPNVPLKVWRHLVVPHAIKRLASFLVTNIVPSEHMAKYFPKAIVIPNPFDEATFNIGHQVRTRDLLFVGRLIVEKGCDVLLQSFARVAPGHPDVNLTIIGEGPKRAELEAWVAAHGLCGRVRFLGSQPASEVARQMRRHLVLVVPTLCDEAFGIVALEGLACGSRVVVSRVGGLPDAVGDYALGFERGDVDGLADCLRNILDGGWTPNRAGVEQHLRQHTPAAIAHRYLEVLESTLARKAA